MKKFSLDLPTIPENSVLKDLHDHYRPVALDGQILDFITGEKLTYENYLSKGQRYRNNGNNFVGFPAVDLAFFSFSRACILFHPVECLPRFSVMSSEFSVYICLFSAETLSIVKRSPTKLIRTQLVDSFTRRVNKAFPKISSGEILTILIPAPV